MEHPAHRERTDPQKAACVCRVHGLLFADNLLAGRTFTATMNTTISDTVLEEVLDAKDRLSDIHGHDLAATCRAIYSEQAKAPGRYVVLGVTKNGQADLIAEKAAKGSPEGFIKAMSMVPAGETQQEDEIEDASTGEI